MKINPTITIGEMAAILRKALEDKFGLTVDSIQITSHDKVRCVIEFDSDEGADAMVIMTEMRHRT